MSLYRQTKFPKGSMYKEIEEVTPPYRTYFGKYTVGQSGNFNANFTKDMRQRYNTEQWSGHTPDTRYKPILPACFLEGR